VFGFSRALALDATRYEDIHVNLVSPRAQTRLSSPEILSKTMDVPIEVFSDSTRLDAFSPELVSVVVLYLGHESCTLDGETFVAGGGQVMRLAVVQNEGYVKEGMTPEDVAEHLAEAMDLTGAQPIEVGVVARKE
jgi:hypothetical protein